MTCNLLLATTRCSMVFSRIILGIDKHLTFKYFSSNVFRKSNSLYLTQMQNCISLIYVHPRSSGTCVSLKQHRQIGKRAIADRRGWEECNNWRERKPRRVWQQQELKKYNANGGSRSQNPLWVNGRNTGDWGCSDRRRERGTAERGGRQLSQIWVVEMKLGDLRTVGFLEEGKVVGMVHVKFTRCGVVKNLKSPLF